MQRKHRSCPGLRVGFLLFLSACLAGEAVASAQQIPGAPCFGPPAPWPDGCSVADLTWIKAGLDTIFFGACTQHDLCYGTCNTQFGPYHDEALKTECDVAVAASIGATCLYYSTAINYPLGDIQNPQDFVIACTSMGLSVVGALTFLPSAAEAFMQDQCFKGCNPDACVALSLGTGCIPPYNPLTQLFEPPTCGNLLGFGPSFCFNAIPPPPPPSSGGGGGGGGGGFDDSCATITCGCGCYGIYTVCCGLCPFDASFSTQTLQCLSQ
jgi:hypothetical protein